MELEIKKYMGLAEACRVLGYASGNTLRTMAREGKIKNAVKIGGVWFIPKAWVEYRKGKAQKGRGRPRKNVVAE